MKKWTKRCSGAVESLNEAGDDLLTFYSFPKQQWKTIRTTNVIERINEEFRRRVKTQGSFPSENCALVLLYSLVASGQINLRRIDGYEKIVDVIARGRMPPRNKPCYTTPNLHLGEAPSPISTSSGTRPPSPSSGRTGDRSSVTCTPIPRPNAGTSGSGTRKADHSRGRKDRASPSSQGVRPLHGTDEGPVLGR